MSSPDAITTLAPESAAILLDIASDSIRHGLLHRRPIAVDLAVLPDELAVTRATFTTLTKQAALRGCIGTLEACRPLAVDVAHNAYAAAFQDPRFPPLETSEFEALDIHISMLTPAMSMTFRSETELLDQLVPFEDGLILEVGQRRGTFLPSVWESLPEPLMFLQHLKLKAGLPPDYWSDAVRVARYRTEVIARHASEKPR